MIRILALAFLVMAEPVSAQQVPCGPVAQVESLLVEKYGEDRVVTGRAWAAGQLTVWANPATGTWTLALLRPDGMLCLTGSGDQFAAAEPVKPGEMN